MNANKIAQNLANNAASTADAGRFARLRQEAAKYGVEREPVLDRSGDTCRLSEVLDIEEARRSN